MSEETVSKDQLVNELNSATLQKVMLDERIRDLRSALVGYEMAEKHLVPADPKTV